ncbi:MAG: septal ring lytic transglycosylase RlpA family protein [Steroidobacteraceae bacterium]|nr:septal ring lytic transglycosylase RlpA family protein [Steroidobacteraceae bacterium]MCC7198910.1 septal ring lytic transglycosylase RlpA family protein [Gammaproteobacteria bacterium]
MHRRSRKGAGLALLALVALVAGCAGQPTRPTPPPRPTPTLPADLAAIPDAVPRAEARAVRGNPASYEVLGRRYAVLPDATGFVERGVASWYGPDFHGGNTSMGEPYDMYAMTAAHKTLPLPAYARVTNLANGRSIVVRINDRGPFKDNRIIDLSYVAAAKLDMIRAGTAMVELRVLTPSGPPPPAPLLWAGGRYVVQAGSFTDEDNAQRLLARLRDGGFDEARIVPAEIGGRRFWRVRLGPVADVEAFDRVAARFSALGLDEPRLALD